MKRCLMLLMALCCACNVHAHKPSDSYLTLDVKAQTILGQWDIALRDLDFAIGLDANGNGEITWGEVRAKQADIAAYAMAHFQLSAEAQVCHSRVTEQLVDDHTDGAYVVLRFEATCPVAVQKLGAHYSLFSDLDPQHKGLLRLQYQGVASTAIFSPENASQQFMLKHPNQWRQFVDYGREGVWHIWIGFDHILFLLALLLPAVVYREGRHWRAVPAFQPAWWAVVKIVTAFTVAHSITLSLATLGLMSLPSRWVESTIAASVVIAALNNLLPLFRERRWMMAFLFGLIHGFGFASVLSDLGLPQGALVRALVGFNGGVEVGQLAIVASFLPIAFALRHTKIYRQVILQGGSIGIAIVAAIWLMERAFDMKILPF